MGFVRHQEGSTAVEFALVFPVLLMLMTLMLEVGSYFFHATVLEAVVAQACNATLMGRGDEKEIRQGLKKHLQQQDPARLLDADRLHLTLSMFGNSDSYYKRNQRIFNPVQPDEPIVVDANILAITGAASAAEVILVNVHYDWQPILPFTQTLLGRLPDIESRGLLRYEPI